MYVCMYVCMYAKSYRSQLAVYSFKSESVL